RRRSRRSRRPPRGSVLRGAGVVPGSRTGSPRRGSGGSAGRKQVVVVAAVEPGPCPREVLGALAAGEPDPDRGVLGTPRGGVHIAARDMALRPEHMAHGEALG